MEIKQYQPGEKRHIDKSTAYVISPHSRSVRGGFDTKKTDFDYTVYDKTGKKITLKMF